MLKEIPPKGVTQSLETLQCDACELQVPRCTRISLALQFCSSASCFHQETICPFLNATAEACAQGVKSKQPSCPLLPQVQMLGEEGQRQTKPSLPQPCTITPACKLTKWELLMSLHKHRRNLYTSATGNSLSSHACREGHVCLEYIGKIMLPPAGKELQLAPKNKTYTLVQLTAQSN